MFFRKTFPLVTTLTVLTTLSTFTSFSLIATILSISGFTQAEVTVYSQVPLGHLTADPARITLGAYDELLLTPPPLPSVMPANTFTLELDDQVGAANSGAGGASIIQRHGAWWGYSIEMSVITQVLGRNSTHLHVPFLNLLSNIAARGGQIRIRMGGNTQEHAEHVDVTPSGGTTSLEKEKLDSGRTTLTPRVFYTTDWFYMMTNVSSMVNVGWYLGIPFLHPDPFDLRIVEFGTRILGDRLLALQGGNEPDFYQPHKLRGENSAYSIEQYVEEFGTLVTQLAGSNLLPTKQFLLGPSVSNIEWNAKQVFDAGFLQRYAEDLSAITVERYPTNNCGRFAVPPAPTDPQQAFAGFLSHNQIVALVGEYLEVSAISQANNKPLYMFETNTASCGGFPGISNSMGAALWLLDYGMQMAYANFSGAQLHIGGQDTFYNPFTSTPTNQSAFAQWSVGAVYYSTLIMAEAFGMNNASQILDLRQAGQSGQNEQGDGKFPQYSIYDNGKLSKVALFNYYTAPGGPQGANGGSGAGGWGAPGQYTANLHMNGAAMPSKVFVKYLTASSVSDRKSMLWAGQSVGTTLDSDGRFNGTLNITEISCDVTAATCGIPVPAPGFALVFLSEDAARKASPEAEKGEVKTFATTARTKARNTATIDQAILETSNGHTGSERAKHLGSTSVKGQSGAVGITPTVLIMSIVGATALGVVTLLMH